MKTNKQTKTTFIKVVPGGKIRVQDCQRSTYGLTAPKERTPSHVVAVVVFGSSSALQSEHAAATSIAVKFATSAGSEAATLKCSPISTSLSPLLPTLPPSTVPLLTRKRHQGGAEQLPAKSGSGSPGRGLQHEAIQFNIRTRAHKRTQMNTEIHTEMQIEANNRR